jgi:hypothetical protein
MAKKKGSPNIDVQASEEEKMFIDYLIEEELRTPIKFEEEEFTQEELFVWSISEEGEDFFYTVIPSKGEAG